MAGEARRRACLEAMGIQVWSLRGGTTAATAGAAEAAVPEAAPESPVPPPTAPPTDRTRAPVTATREPSARPDRPAPVRPPEPPEVTPPTDGEPPHWEGPDWSDVPPDFGPLPPDDLPPGDWEPVFDVPEAAPAPPAVPRDWPGLERAVAACRRCEELVRNRSRTVFGVGNRAADWMIVGEAPGADEDRQGEPFVGRAGKLLDQMLLAIGLPRERVFIANILKCRPPNNRDPKPEEAAACRAFLARQIELVNPKIILVVGRVAAQNLLGSSEPIGRLRGREHRPADLAAPVVVTYHPAYLLRSPAEKRKTWADLRLARGLLRSMD